jgi:phenylalanine-4-hydroxylase
MTEYIAKKTKADGSAEFTQEENETWQILYKRQLEIVKNRACDEFIHGLEVLGMPQDRVPQVPEISKILMEKTGWSVHPVPAIIEVDEFFTLLANKKFPAATFIRTRADLDYIEEPDIFHEYFGHCPLLTNQVYADFLEWYGKFALAADDTVRSLLARLFWFTIEFGLVKTAKGYKVYGGGILSSKNETVYAIDSNKADRRDFDLKNALRTPYRIDIMQPIYYCIENFSDLYELMKVDLVKAAKDAVDSGDFIPTFHTC